VVHASVTIAPLEQAAQVEAVIALIANLDLTVKHFQSLAHFVRKTSSNQKMEAKIASNAILELLLQRVHQFATTKIAAIKLVEKLTVLLL